MTVIDSFSGQYAWLSNFYTAPVPLDGVNYLSVEHAYQAAKTLNPKLRLKIKLTSSAGSAKRLGRQLELREDWEDVKLKIMEDLVYQKFTIHEGLRLKLVATNPAELVEGNHWGDTFWGVCKGEGENHLGKILMIVRDHVSGSLWPQGGKS